MEQICEKCQGKDWRTVISSHAWQCRKCGFVRQENFWVEPTGPKWDRSEGTSKKEQGVLTPPPPRYKKTSAGALRCHCLFRGNQLWEICSTHKYGLEMANSIYTHMQEVEESKKAAVPAPEAPKAKPGAWHDDTKAAEDVTVSIITPNETQTPTA